LLLPGKNEVTNAEFKTASCSLEFMTLKTVAQMRRAVESVAATVVVSTKIKADPLLRNKPESVLHTESTSAGMPAHVVQDPVAAVAAHVPSYASLPKSQASSLRVDSAEPRKKNRKPKPSSEAAAAVSIEVCIVKGCGKSRHRAEAQQCEFAVFVAQQKLLGKDSEDKVKLQGQNQFDAWRRAFRERFPDLCVVVAG
jgi:hypothetical protein